MCKSRMNTFAYMGDLKGSPDVACVYHSEEAENQYLDNMRKGGAGSMAGMMGGLGPKKQQQQQQLPAAQPPQGGNGAAAAAAAAAAANANSQ